MIVTNYTTEDLIKLPLRAIVALSARCARRVEDLALLPDDHPEKERCRAAAANAIRLAEDFASGLPCPYAESVVSEIEQCRAVTHDDFVRDNALATCLTAARSAVNALHALDLYGESATSRSVGSSKPNPIGQLAEVTADLAARVSFTAAFEAVAADGHTDPFITAAIEDYQNLLRLGLGKYPEAGKPIDPSSKGPLGPLGVGEAKR
jgi:hypothetical protein